MNCQLGQRKQSLFHTESTAVGHILTKHLPVTTETCEVMVTSSVPALPRNNLGQLVDTLVYLLTSGIILYQSNNGDAPWLKT